jgi:hypothetical protein
VRIKAGHARQSERGFLAHPCSRIKARSEYKVRLVGGGGEGEEEGEEVIVSGKHLEITHLRTLVDDFTDKHEELDKALDERQRVRTAATVHVQLLLYLTRSTVGCVLYLTRSSRQ